MQKQAVKRLRNITFPRLTGRETAEIGFGSFLIALGGTTLMSCQTRGARMLFLIGAGLAAFGSAKSVGAMLFVRAAYRLAMIAAEGRCDGKSALFSAARGVIGAALVLFSSQSGALAAASLIALGALWIASIFWPKGAMLRTFPKTDRR